MWLPQKGVVDSVASGSTVRVHERDSNKKEPVGHKTTIYNIHVTQFHKPTENEAEGYGLE